MYESLIMIDPDETITIDDVAKELRRFYADDPDAPTSIDVQGQTVSLKWPEYLLEVVHEALPHVLEESRELAERFGKDHPRRDRIARCTERFATAGDDDPNMDHFNDYLFLGEAIERLGTVYRFDQSSSEFWDEAELDS